MEILAAQGASLTTGSLGNSTAQPQGTKIMRYRQIHLDFHTSEHIPGIGSRFDPDKFADTFARADVDSVTVFSKCHHGWS